MGEPILYNHVGEDTGATGEMNLFGHNMYEPTFTKDNGDDCTALAYARYEDVLLPPMTPTVWGLYGWATDLKIGFDFELIVNFSETIEMINQITLDFYYSTAFSGTPEPFNMVFSVYSNGEWLECGSQIECDPTYGGDTTPPPILYNAGNYGLESVLFFRHHIRENYNQVDKIKVRVVCPTVDTAEGWHAFIFSQFTAFSSSLKPIGNVNSDYEVSYYDITDDAYYDAIMEDTFTYGAESGAEYGAESGIEANTPCIYYEYESGNAKIYKYPLVATNHEFASKTRMYDGVSVKAFPLVAPLDTEQFEI